MIAHLRYARRVVKLTIALALAHTILAAMQWYQILDGSDWWEAIALGISACFNSGLAVCWWFRAFRSAEA